MDANRTGSLVFCLSDWDNDLIAAQEQAGTEDDCSKSLAEHHQRRKPALIMSLGSRLHTNNYIICLKESHFSQSTSETLINIVLCLIKNINKIVRLRVRNQHKLMLDDCKLESLYRGF